MAYKRFEDQYFEMLAKILNEGTVCVSARQTTDEKVTRTKRIWGYTYEIDLQEEFPLMYSKHVAAKTACQEILWIMQKQSNNVNEAPFKIWNQWADEDGSIHKAYGYLVGKEVNHPTGHYDNQMEFVTELLKKDPSSRHAVIVIWEPETMDDNNCIACCYTSHYTIMDGKLNIAVFQRSADSIIGLPFNIAQYAFLGKALARHLGVEPGKYVHVITDAHIYEDQYGNFDTMEMSADFAEMMENYRSGNSKNLHADVQFDESSKSFWDITYDNFKILDYEIGKDCCRNIPFNVTK